MKHYIVWITLVAFPANANDETAPDYVDQCASLSSTASGLCYCLESESALERLDCFDETFSAKSFLRSANCEIQGRGFCAQDDTLINAAKCSENRREVARLDCYEAIANFDWLWADSVVLFARELAAVPGGKEAMLQVLDELESNPELINGSR